jgi:hypothetical protein
MRQERADTDTDGQEEINQNGLMPSGGDDCVGELECGVTVDVPQVQSEQQGLAEVAEGRSGPESALDETMDAGCDNGGDPVEAWALGDPGLLMEDFPGQFEVEKYTETPIDVDVGSYLVAEQLAETEISFEELTGGRSAEELLGPPPPGDMSDMPPLS